jgi:hypothetical protein
LTKEEDVKQLGVLAIALTFFVMPALAQKKSCEELKTEIAAKLDASGVKNYTLNVVDAADVKDAKVVGSCDGGAKRITYEKK